MKVVSGFVAERVAFVFILMVCVCSGASVPSTTNITTGCPNIDAPNNGLRIGNTFTFGQIVTFQCAKNYELRGEMQSECLPNGTWTAETPTCQHICKNVQCPVGTKCVASANESASCVCKVNMDCTALMQVVCGSDGETYTNECIMKATGCRRSENITVVHNDRCIPGHRCSIVPASSCRAAFPVFYYNQAKRRCLPMTAGGCHPSGWNGFHLKSECNRDCNHTDICTNLGADSGPCNKQLQRWYYDSSERECKSFIYGGCFGNTNNFVTKKDCQRLCKPKKVARARRIKNDFFEDTTT